MRAGSTRGDAMQRCVAAMRRASASTLASDAGSQRRTLAATAHHTAPGPDRCLSAGLDAARQPRPPVHAWHGRRSHAAPVLARRARAGSPRRPGDRACGRDAGRGMRVPTGGQTWHVARGMLGAGLCRARQPPIGARTQRGPCADLLAAGSRQASGIVPDGSVAVPAQLPSGFSEPPSEPRPANSPRRAVRCRAGAAVAMGARPSKARAAPAELRPTEGLAHSHTQQPRPLRAARWPPGVSLANRSQDSWAAVHPAG